MKMKRGLTAHETRYDELPEVMEMECRTCDHAKKSSGGLLYCILFGIFIRASHDLCRYHKNHEDDHAEKQT